MAQVFDGDAVEIVADQPVQLLPHGQRLAGLGPLTGVRGAVQARHRRQRPFRQPQDLPDRIFARRTVKPIAAALAPQPVHKPGLGQNDDNTLQIFN